MTSTLRLFAVAQGLLGVRVFARMLATAAGDPIAAASQAPSEAGSLSALLPVLDERRRLGPCLDGLLLQPAALGQIVVIDGGSRDGTRELVREYAARDERVRLIDAGPPPPGWNGKAWNLACGLAATSPDAAWILMLDADVRPGPYLVASLLTHAVGAYVDAFSAAPLLELSSAGEAALHPAFLATLVYRYGLPGKVATRAREVQANGQCFMAKRALLVRTKAFAAARASRCEDVSVARHLAREGAQVGFYEGGRLARVRMYESARECWLNWPRSLVLRDASTARATLTLAFAELALVQALPLAVVLASFVAGARRDTPFYRLNAALALARLGVLAGTRRAYANAGAAYWLACFSDVPAVLRLAHSAVARRHVWRGRTLVPERSR